MPAASSPKPAERFVTGRQPGAGGTGGGGQRDTFLVLLRHGRTELNRRRLLQGASDLPLDEVGRQQAAEAGDYIRRHWDIDRVVSSPRRRTRQMLELAGFANSGGDGCGALTIDDRLAEIDYGDFEGKPIAEVAGELYDAWSADPGFVPRGGESLAALFERAAAACADLLDAAAGQTVLVCSHANPIKAIVAWALGGSPETMLRMYLRQASVTVVAWRPPVPVLLSFNERAGAAG